MKTGEAIWEPASSDPSTLRASAVKGDVGGLLGRAAAAASRGEQEFRFFVDTLKDSQIEGLAWELGKAVKGSTWAPPPRGEGYDPSVKKDRMTYLWEQLKKISPPVKQGEAMADRFLGDDSVLEEKNKQSEKRRRLADIEVR